MSKELLLKLRLCSHVGAAETNFDALQKSSFPRFHGRFAEPPPGQSPPPPSAPGHGQGGFGVSQPFCDLGGVGVGEVGPHCRAVIWGVGPQSRCGAADRCRLGRTAAVGARRSGGGRGPGGWAFGGGGGCGGHPLAFPLRTADRCPPPTPRAASGAAPPRTSVSLPTLPPADQTRRQPINAGTN